MLRMLAFSSAIALLVGCGASPVENAAITVDGEVVTRDELAPVLQQFQGDSAIINLRVESIVNRIAILHDARSRGLDALPVMQRFKYDTRRRRLHQSWLDTVLGEVVLPPDTVDAFYPQLGTIVCFTGITVEDSLECDSLRLLVLSGADFNEVVFENSVNHFEQQRGGMNGPLDHMLVSMPDRQYVTELEIGELSPIYLSDFEYRFIRLDTMWVDTIPPLEEIRESLEGLLISSMKNEYQSYLEDSLMDAYHLQMNESIPQLISARYNEEAGCFDPFTEEENETLVFTYGGGELSLREMVDLMLDLSPVMGRNPSDFYWVDDYCRMIAQQEIIVLEALKLGLDTMPENTSYLDIRFSNKLLDVYYNEIISPRTTPDDEYLHAYFQANIEEFSIPQRRIFNVVGALDPQQIRLLEDIVSSGENPFSRVDDLTALTDLTAEGESTVTQALEMEDIPSPWDSMLFGAELNEMVYCSVATDRMFLFQVSEIQPERLALYEESLEELIVIATQAREEEVVTGLVDSLKSIYHIEIDSVFIDSFIYEDTSSVEIPLEQVQSDSQTTT